MRTYTAMPREKAQVATTTRPKVPMRRLGADCLVVVMKRGNARGAKGAGHRHWRGSTGNGRNPLINGRRQPSCDGTSRISREAYVRICERLGVKFPVPTRRLERGLEVQAFSGREIGGDDDVLDFLVRHLVDVDLTILSRRSLSDPAYRKKG